MLLLDHVFGYILHCFIIDLNQNSNVYPSTSCRSEQVNNPVSLCPIERIHSRKKRLYVKSSCFDTLSYKLEYRRWILHSLDIFSLKSMLQFFDLIPCRYSVI